jgi:hypothetical protein
MPSILTGALTRNDATPEQRQRLIELATQRLQERTGGVSEREQGEVLAGMEQENRRGRLAGLVDQYYQARLPEIDRYSRAGYEANVGDAQADARTQERQSRLALARSGNVGGSTRQEHIGGINLGLRERLMRAQAQADEERARMLQENEQRRLSLLERVYGLSPEEQAARAEVLGGYGERAQAEAERRGLLRQQNEYDQFAGDELSRALGGVLSGLGNVYKGYSRRQGYEEGGDPFLPPDRDYRVVTPRLPPRLRLGENFGAF